MSRSPLLYLAPDGLHCYQQQKQTTEHIEHFSPDTIGHEAFAGWLRGFSAGTPFTILVDLPDERFKIETLPHLRGPDRKRLRERRQAQIFPDTPFVAHQYLDREQSGRKDDRILFTALNRPSTITPWLDAIEHLGHRLQRLVPMPFLTATLSRHLPVTRGPLLLVLLTPAGLRVSCVEGHKLLFSHLRPASAPVPPPISQWMEDARETYRHLLGQRLATHDIPCPCHLLAPPGRDATRPADVPPGHNDLHFVLHDSSSLPAGAPRASHDGGDSLAWLLHRLGRHPRLPQATPAETLHASRLHQIGLACKAGAAAILLLCAAVTTANLLAIQDLEQQSASAIARGTASEQTLAALMAASPASPYPLAQLEVAIDTLQRLDTSAADPAPALRQLASALAPIPDVALRRIDWMSDGKTDTTQNTPPPTQQVILHFALPHEGTRQRVTHTRHIIGALQAIPGARLYTEQLPIEMMADQPLSPAALEAQSKASSLVVRLELPIAEP